MALRKVFITIPATIMKQERIRFTDLVPDTWTLVIATATGMFSITDSIKFDYASTLVE
ncbi:hypothetical protein GCM10028805_17970 [Spirosoma harenae]